MPFADGTTPARTTFRNLHSDGINSDEISTAVAPMLREAWTAEAATYNVTGPVFDSAGRLYFSPLIPYENVVLISIDPATGARRWAIPGTGAPAGGGTPMVMADPDAPGSEIVYLGLYDRALAVHTDGTIVWDVPTGLTLGPDPFVNLVTGVNYLPGADAIVGLTGDGRVYFLDRRTGASLLPAPFSLPGEPSPAVPPALPQSLRDAADVLFRQLVNTPPGGLGRLTDALLGNNIEVANFFSVDPRTDRLWIAATAPDAEDGTVDGVSELGALYRLDVTGGPGGLVVSEVCHASFAGGSASTPDVRGDGARVYVADNFGKVLGIDATDCSQIWEIAVRGQVVGSLGTSSDNGEIYASTLNSVVQIFDRGAQAQLGWTAALNVFQGLGPNELSFNLNLVTVGANGLAFQAGAGTILNGIPLAETLGVGVLDRAASAGACAQPRRACARSAARRSCNEPYRRTPRAFVGLTHRCMRVRARLEPLGVRQDTLLRPGIPLTPNTSTGERNADSNGRASQSAGAVGQQSSRRHRGTDRAASPYPSTSRNLRLPRQSLDALEKTLVIDAVASATPSTNPMVFHRSAEDRRHEHRQDAVDQLRRHVHEQRPEAERPDTRRQGAPRRGVRPPESKARGKAPCPW